LYSRTSYPVVQSAPKYFRAKSESINPMTNVNITASEPNKPATPAQPSQSPQQTQQPGDNQNQQQGDAPNKDKPAQQK